ncbi:MAG: hypothetical protein EOP85_07745 [Verrucomicrobiaceae bacterium]|nr:MAG: hypothetical protein EOP85_07745 [Verrucomicrobiaceae bacterium]
MTAFFLLSAFLPVMLMGGAIGWWLILAGLLFLLLSGTTSVVLTERFSCPACLAKPLAFDPTSYPKLRSFLVRRKLMTSWEVITSNLFTCQACGEMVAVRQIH